MVIRVDKVMWVEGNYLGCGYNNGWYTNTDYRHGS